jgi:hypothetical protein
LFGKPKRSRLSVKSRIRSEDNTKIYLREVGREVMVSAEMACGVAATIMQ